MGATVAIGATVLGGIQRSRAEAKAGRENAKIAKQNAAIQEALAVDAKQRGKEAEFRHRIDVRRLIGKQRAAFAAQGVELDSGSPLEVQQDTAVLGAMDAVEIRNNAAREAWGYKVGALDYQLQSDVAKRIGTSNATATLLSTGADAANSYWRMTG